MEKSLSLKSFSLKTVFGDVKYPYVSLIIKFMIILPFGTTSVERDFSIVNINKLRNRLDTTTLDALVRAREFLPNDILNFVPTPEMYNLFNSTMYQNSVYAHIDDIIEFFISDC